MNKFKINDVVLYKNGNTYKLGVIKEVIKIESQDNLFNDIYIEYKYRVWYHSGDTTAVTDEALLIPIDNINNFTVIRHSVNSEIQLSPARQLASRILGQIELYGDYYYKLEDWLTAFLEGREKDIPLGLEAEYLRCALRVEIRKFVDEKGFEDFESDQVENVVNDILSSFNKNVLDMELIEEAITKEILGF